MTEEHRTRITRQNKSVEDARREATTAIAATCCWVAILVCMLIFGAFWSLE